MLNSLTIQIVFNRHLPLSELQRYRRQFITYTKMHPVEDTKRLSSMFVSYLNSYISWQKSIYLKVIIFWIKIQKIILILSLTYLWVLASRHLIVFVFASTFTSLACFEWDFLQQYFTTRYYQQLHVSYYIQLVSMGVLLFM